MVLDSCLLSFSESVKLKPINHIDEWADKKCFLEAGKKYDLSRAPYQKEIQKALSWDSPTKLVVVEKGVQLGITTVALNSVGQRIEEDPCNILYVMPTGAAVEDVSKNKFMPMVENTPSLREIIADSSVRDGKNTINAKSYNGKILWFIGGNSSASARSKSAKYVILDEFDEYPHEIKDQGSGLKTYKGRMASYGDQGKMLIISTPVELKKSKIHPEFLSGSQEYYHVPCPFCKHLQVLKWANFKYDGRDASSIRLKCCNADCGQEIKETWKTWMMAEENGARWIALNPNRQKQECRSFHISSLYSPIGYLSWRDICQDWFEAQEDYAKLKTFSLLTLGEPWEDKHDKPTSLQELKSRRRHYECEVEKDILVLTAGVDIQHNRLEVSVWGWGLNGKCSLIKHEVFYAPDGRHVDHPLVWEQLELFRQKKFKHQSGVDIQIAAMGIDTAGGYELDAYDFVRGKYSEYCRGFKGSSKPGAPLLSRPSFNNKGKIPLTTVGTDTAKRTLFGKLRAKTPSEHGYVSFHERVDDEFLAQLLSEELTTKREKNEKGKYENVKVFKKIRDRNEALDCFVYAFAVLHSINPDWVALAELYSGTKKEQETEKPAEGGNYEEEEERNSIYDRDQPTGKPTKFYRRKEKWFPDRD